ncbi:MULTISPECIES: DMT family transporter [Chromobacteriaceae]|uniref:Multidrug DMT transporter n=1 Tax=Pseudogulbenkiania ferrooxidans EGD-HP2 TaxID=1388764 RepID=A0ABP2XJN0_9NEIS|nr:MULTISPECIES: DMT family transporter [Chromobacteriaceae]AVG18302.1 EamA/RhaT family transporter [Chromobacterium vaccinii]ERE04666.1 multidrug DMT transporter [Pseudogulbenkiania ferrooxidans EGD-HP2]
MAMLFPLLAVLIWAANTIVSKAAAQVLDPAAISIYRWLLAALVLTPFCLPVLRRRAGELKPWLGKLLALAMLGMVMFQCLAYYAAHSTSATNMGVITALVPLLGLLLNAAVFRQKVAALAWLGVAVSLAGVVYLLGKGDPLSLLANGVNTGDALILAGAASYALYGILLRRWAPPFGAWLNLYLQASLAVLLLLPLTLTAQSMAIPAKGIGLVLFAGIGSSLLAAYLWMRGIQKLGSERTAIFMNLLPLFTAVLASALLGETIHHYHWLGGGLILLGVALGQGMLKLGSAKKMAFVNK